MMREGSRCGAFSASAAVNGGRRLSLAIKLPYRWQARMRSISITGVLLASDSSKPCCTAVTMLSRRGLGSSSQSCDFMAKAWVRSCMMLAPSP